MSAGCTTTMSKWTLDEGLEVVRWFTPILAKVGFSIGLTGSVLTKGESNKDLDIIVYPLCTDRGGVAEAKIALVLGGAECKYGRFTVTNAWREKGSLDNKHVEIWTYKGRRIDVFFLT